MTHIGAVIPTRGDRSELLKQCIKMLKAQTFPVDEIIIIDEEPKSVDKDITYRYKKGLAEAFEKGCDVVFMWEDDDWYSPNYVEVMYKAWINFGRPQIIGIGETTYYHLHRQSYSKMVHPLRSSAFATMVTKDVMDIKFPEDNYPFLDMHIWQQLKGETFIPYSPICLGIKHGVGVCGGRGHNNDFKYDSVDSDYNYLKSIVGPSWKYYKSLLGSIVA